VRDAVSGKTVLCLRHFYWDHIDDGVAGVEGLAEYSQKLVDFFGRKGVFIQTSTPTAEEAVALSETLHKIMSK
jgi:restriction endonuclease Mrr